jgi:hypothetical protein
MPRVEGTSLLQYAKSAIHWNADNERTMQDSKLMTPMVVTCNLKNPIPSASRADD